MRRRPRRRAPIAWPGTNLNTLIGRYDDLLPGNLDPNHELYPGQVDGHGCIYPWFDQQSRSSSIACTRRTIHVAARRDYDEDMGNQPTGRELGARDSLGGLDCAHPPLNGADSTNAASPATATEPADQYAASIGQIGAGAGGLHGADEFLAYWVALLEASPAYHLGQMLIVVTFDEGDSADGTACCGEAPGSDSPTPGFSPLLAPIFQRYVEPGSVDPTRQITYALLGAATLRGSARDHPGRHRWARPSRLRRRERATAVRLLRF